MSRTSSWSWCWSFRFWRCRDTQGLVIVEWAARSWSTLLLDKQISDISWCISHFADSHSPTVTCVSPWDHWPASEIITVSSSWDHRSEQRWRHLNAAKTNGPMRPCPSKRTLTMLRLAMLPKMVAKLTTERHLLPAHKTRLGTRHENRAATSQGKSVLELAPKCASMRLSSTYQRSSIQLHCIMNTYIPIYIYIDIDIDIYVEICVREVYSYTQKLQDSRHIPVGPTDGVAAPGLAEGWCCHLQGCGLGTWSFGPWRLKRRSWFLLGHTENPTSTMLISDIVWKSYMIILYVYIYI